MKKNRLLSLFLALVMLFGVVSALGASAMAAVTGTGTASNPYIVTNYKDLKDKLQSGENCYIVVNHFESTSGFQNCYYLNAKNGDYKGQDVAISVPAGTTKHLTINTKLEFMSNGDPALYSFIGVDGGTLYVNGTGSINVTFNATFARNGVFLLQGYAGKLILGGSITVRGDTDAADVYGAGNCAGHAVVNESGIVTINSGTYIGRLDAAIITRASGNTTINGGTFTLEEPNDSTCRTLSIENGICLIKGGSFRFASGNYYDYLDSGLCLIDDENNKKTDRNDIDASRSYRVGALFTGTVTVSPSEPYEGQTLTANLSGAAASIPANKIHYQWQQDMSEDGGFWRDIAGETNRTMTAGSVKTKYRVKVTADGYSGALTSDYVRVVEGQPPLTGTVTVSQTNTSNGITLTANLGGAAANIPADKLHYDWRYVLTTDAYGRIRPTGGTYKTLTLPQGDYSTRRYFVYVTADGYEGYLQSSYVRIDAGSSYPKGDVDRSGQVGNSDLIMVARHVVHIITLTGEQFTLGDMDNDNVIDNKDIISVARKVVGL